MTERASDSESASRASGQRASLANEAAICLSAFQWRQIVARERAGGPGGKAPGPINGAEGQNRTADTVIFSHVLYQLSYLGTQGSRRAKPNGDHNRPLAELKLGATYEVGASLAVAAAC